MSRYGQYLSISESLGREDYESPRIPYEDAFSRLENVCIFLVIKNVCTIRNFSHLLNAALKPL